MSASVTRRSASRLPVVRPAAQSAVYDPARPAAASPRACSVGGGLGTPQSRRVPWQPFLGVCAAACGQAEPRWWGPFLTQACCGARPALPGWAGASGTGLGSVWVFLAEGQRRSGEQAGRPSPFTPPGPTSRTGVPPTGPGPLLWAEGWSPVPFPIQQGILRLREAAGGARHREWGMYPHRSVPSLTLGPGGPEPHGQRPAGQ